MKALRAYCTLVYDVDMDIYVVGMYEVFCRRENVFIFCVAMAVNFVTNLVIQ